MLLGFHVKKDARPLLRKVASRAVTQASGLFNQLFVINLRHEYNKANYEQIKLRNYREDSKPSSEHVLPHVDFGRHGG
jgi:hypothetical protein